jgi:hypothetical protein
MKTTLKRKSFFVDEAAIRRAQRVLGVGTEAEAVREAVERIVDMERFWRLMKRSRSSVTKGSFGAV